MKNDFQKTGALLISATINRRDGNRQFVLPALPYAENGLEPYISAQTIQYHYGKHFAAYLKNLNDLIKGTPFEDKLLEEIVATSEGGLFNNAAQSYNHAFYFESLRPAPQGDNLPTGKIKALIDTAFGSFDAFKTAFAQAGATQFGSGWAWLILNDAGQGEIVKTGNADTPLKQGKKPLLTVDVWEHAYYLDTQNARPKYLENYWHIIDWEKVNQRLG